MTRRGWRKSIQELYLEMRADLIGSGMIHLSELHFQATKQKDVHVHVYVYTYAHIFYRI